MAKRRRKSRMRGIGSLKGGAKGLLPVATGVVLTGATTLGLRAYLRPEPGAMSEKLYKFAPWIGVGAGALGAAGLYFMAGKGSRKAGMEAAYTAGLVSLATGGILFASEALNAAKVGAAGALASGGAGANGMGAILAEYAPQHNGLGAIVMEPLAGAYGESVNVNGLGAGYNPAAFGTSPF